MIRRLELFSFHKTERLQSWLQSRMLILEVLVTWFYAILCGGGFTMINFTMHIMVALIWQIKAKTCSAHFLRYPKAVLAVLDRLSSHFWGWDWGENVVRANLSHDSRHILRMQYNVDLLHIRTYQPSIILWSFLSRGSLKNIHTLGRTECRPLRLTTMERCTCS